MQRVTGRYALSQLAAAHVCKEKIVMQVESLAAAISCSSYSSVLNNTAGAPRLLHNKQHSLPLDYSATQQGIAFCFKGVVLHCSAPKPPLYCPVLPLLLTHQAYLHSPPITSSARGGRYTNTCCMPEASEQSAAASPAAAAPVPVTSTVVQPFAVLLCCCS